MASTILVIDDDPIAHEAIEGLLVREGHSFVHADGARQAYALLEGASVDLVICDVRMPDVDGFEVCRALKSHPRWRTIPIVLVTALDSEDDMVRGLEAGADEFLSKPVDKVVLRARVRVMLRIREQYNALARPRDLSELMVERRQRLAADANLSAREREVLELLLLGRTQEEIGTALGISPRTAKFHQANVLQKLGADSRSDLLRVLLG